MSVQITIDLDKDFDGIDLEVAIEEARKLKADRAEEILTRLHHLWVTKIGHPEWSKELAASQPEASRPNGPESDPAQEQEGKA